VQASSETQRVVVTFDPARVSPDKIKTKLLQLGYHV
jgi:copper chaperone CopZ